MLRTFDVILIVIMIAAAAVTYRIKQEAELKLVSIQKLQREVAQENDSIKLLRAEWSLLTEPSRLQKLVDVYRTQLDLGPIDPRQISSFRDLPERPISVPAARSSGDVAVMPTDKVTTGSVRR